MKKYLFLPFILTILFTGSQAQNDPQVVVNEIISEMSKGTVTGYELMIPEQTYKSLKNDLSKYLRKGSKSRVEEANGELYIKGAVVKNITADPLNIYIKPREVTDGVILTGWFTTDDQIFFSSAANPPEAAAIRKYLRDFGIEKHRQAVKEELNSQKQILKRMEDELKGQESDKQRSERAIKQAERTIENNKRSLETTIKLLTSKEEELLQQREVVSRLTNTGGEEEQLAKSNLKKLEKEKRKLEKEQNSLSKKNDKLASDIENQKRNINQNLKDQDRKSDDIRKQQDKVKQIEKRLDQIR
ncbi:MAG: hypothetical protein LC117_07205 [Bacteroidia bacterium]|nr:hypothetical protein [Bacteroidia bacterium]MCZ2277698.1 hypothetical protein [Bacteroidia bacterium]